MRFSFRLQDFSSVLLLLVDEAKRLLMGGIGGGKKLGLALVGRARLRKTLTQ